MAPKKTPYYGFRLPQLDKSVYLALKALCERYQATQAEIVSVGILTLSENPKLPTAPTDILRYLRTTAPSDQLL